MGSDITSRIQADIWAQIFQADADFEEGWLKGDAQGAGAEVEHAVEIAYASHMQSQYAIPRIPLCEWALSRWVVDCLDAKRFLSEFHGKRPVIITRQVSEETRKRFTRDSVLREYGSSPVAITFGGVFPVQNEGGGKKLLDPLEGARARVLADARLMIFDTWSTAAAKQLAARVQTPSVIAPALAGVEDSSLWLPFMSLAGVGAGLPTHRHGETWSTLLAGRKRWFVWPAGWGGHQLPPPFLNRTGWLRDHLGDGRGDRPLPQTVLQMPGDCFYLPTDWAHATFNLDESLLIGRQRSYQADERGALVTACFPARPPALDDGVGDPNACVVQGHLRRQLAENPGYNREQELTGAAFYYLKAFLLQPRDVRAAAGYMACARAELRGGAGAWGSKTERPGREDRKRMLREATRALEAAEDEWRAGRDVAPRGRARGGSDQERDREERGRELPAVAVEGVEMDQVKPLLASAWMLLANAADAPTEVEERQGLRLRAEALMSSDDPALRQLLVF